jgi:hypothetical protein
MRFFVLFCLVLISSPVFSQGTDSTVIDFERMDPVLISGSLDAENIKNYKILKRRVVIFLLISILRQVITTVLTILILLKKEFQLCLQDFQ